MDVNEDATITDSVHTNKPDTVMKLDSEKILDSDGPPEEEKISPIPPADALTQGDAVHNTGEALGEGTSGNVMDNDSKSEPDFVKIRSSILHQ